MSKFNYKTVDINPVHYKVIVTENDAPDYHLFTMDKRQGKPPVMWYRDLANDNDALSLADYVSSIFPVILP